MIKSVVKKVALALANHSISLKVETLDNEEAFVTVEKEGVYYSLILLSDYAEFSETYFNDDIGCEDQRILLEEKDYEIETLVGKIAGIMDAQIESFRKELEFLMSLGAKK